MFLFPVNSFSSLIDAIGDGGLPRCAYAGLHALVRYSRAPDAAFPRARGELVAKSDNGGDHLHRCLLLDRGRGHPLLVASPRVEGAWSSLGDLLRDILARR